MRLETTAPRPADLRLLPPALAAWLTAGTLIGFAPDAPLGTVALVLWAAAVLSVLMATRSRSLAVVSIALTTAALVATVVAAQAPGRVPPAFADASGG